jgi:hypothetical protein
MKRIKLPPAFGCALLVLACLAFGHTGCHGGGESAVCPPQGSETVQSGKLCNANYVIYKTQNGSLFICAGSNNHELSGVTFDSAKCVANEIVVETKTASGSKYRDTFDKDGKFIKSEQLP